MPDVFDEIKPDVFDEVGPWTETLNSRKLTADQIKKAGGAQAFPWYPKDEPAKQTDGGFWSGAWEGLKGAVTYPFQAVADSAKFLMNPNEALKVTPQELEAGRQASAARAAHPALSLLGEYGLPLDQVAHEAERRIANNESTASMVGRAIGPAPLLLAPMALGKLGDATFTPKVINRALGKGAINELTGANTGRGLAREGIVGGSPEVLHAQVSEAIPRWQETVNSMMDSLDAKNRSVHGAEVMQKAFGEPPLNVPADVWKEFQNRVKVKIDQLSDNTGMLTPADIHNLKNSILPEYNKLTGSMNELTLNKKAADVRRLFDHTVDEKVPGYREVNDHLSDLHHAKDFLNQKMVQLETTPSFLEDPSRLWDLTGAPRAFMRTIGQDTSTGIHTGPIPMAVRTRMAALGTPRFDPTLPEFAQPLPSGVSEPTYSGLAGDPTIPGQKAAYGASPVLPVNESGTVFNPDMAPAIDWTSDLHSMAASSPSKFAGATDFAASEGGLAYPFRPGDTGVVPPPVPFVSEFHPAATMSKGAAKMIARTPKLLPPASGPTVLPSSGATWETDSSWNPNFWRGQQGSVPSGVEPSGASFIGDNVAGMGTVEHVSPDGKMVLVRTPFGGLRPMPADSAGAMVPPQSIMGSGTKGDFHYGGDQETPMPEQEDQQYKLAKKVGGKWTHENDALVASTPLWSLLPEQFQAARRSLGASRAKFENGRLVPDYDATRGSYGEPLRSETDYEKTRSMLGMQDAITTDFPKPLGAAPANDTIQTGGKNANNPFIVLHEYGHGAWEKGLTPAQKKSYELAYRFYSGIIDQIDAENQADVFTDRDSIESSRLEAQRAYDALSPAQRAERKNAERFRFITERGSARHSFSDAISYYIMDPSEMKRRVPRLYEAMKSIFGGREYSNPDTAKSRKIAPPPIRNRRP